MSWIIVCRKCVSWSPMTLSICQPGSREETSSSWIWPDWRRRINHATIYNPDYNIERNRFGFYCKLWALLTDFRLLTLSISHCLISRWSNVKFLSIDQHLSTLSAFLGLSGLTLGELWFVLVCHLSVKMMSHQMMVHTPAAYSNYVQNMYGTMRTGEASIPTR